MHLFPESHMERRNSRKLVPELHMCAVTFMCKLLCTYKVKKENVIFKERQNGILGICEVGLRKSESVWRMSHVWVWMCKTVPGGQKRTQVTCLITHTLCQIPLKRVSDWS